MISFGGLFGTHVLINHLTFFDKYLLLSPSLWWNQKATLKNLEQNPSISPKQIKLYIVTGAFEDGMVGDHLEMACILEKNNSNIKSEILDYETLDNLWARYYEWFEIYLCKRLIHFSPNVLPAIKE